MNRSDEVIESSVGDGVSYCIGNSSMSYIVSGVTYTAAEYMTKLRLDRIEAKLDAIMKHLWIET